MKVTITSVIIIIIMSCSNSNENFREEDLNKDNIVTVNKVIINDSIYYLEYEEKDYLLYLFFKKNGELIKIIKEDIKQNTNMEIYFSNDNILYLAKSFENNLGIKYEYEQGITQSITEYKDYNQSLSNQFFSLSSSVNNEKSIFYRIIKKDNNIFEFYFNKIEEYDNVYLMIGEVDKKRMNVTKPLLDTIIINNFVVSFYLDKTHFEGLLFLENKIEDGKMTRPFYISYPVDSSIYELQM